PFQLYVHVPPNSGYQQRLHYDLHERRPVFYKTNPTEGATNNKEAHKENPETTRTMWQGSLYWTSPISISAPTIPFPPDIRQYFRPPSTPTDKVYSTGSLVHLPDQKIVHSANPAPAYLILG